MTARPEPGTDFRQIPPSESTGFPARLFVSIPDANLKLLNDQGGVC